MSLIIGDVELEYAKTQLLKKEEVEKVWEWAKLQPHLPRMTEMQVVHFLHSSGFRAEEAKKCMDDFFTARSLCPEFFANRCLKDGDLSIMLYTALPKPTPEGFRIIYARLIDTDPHHYNFPSQIKLFDMVTMLMLNAEGTSEGQVVIHDLVGITFSHLAKINLVQLKKFFFYLQECMPVRIKGLHFINSGSLVEKILMLIKPFMKKELYDVLYFHSEMEGIYKFVPKDCFPNDIEGGTAGSIEDLCRKMRENILRHSEFFAEEEKQVVDERKRPGKPKDSGDLFGVDGTFRKLDFD